MAVFAATRMDPVMSDAPPAPTLSDILESFGPVHAEPLSRIQSLTAKAMLRNWTTIPHVTHFDHLDVTELEAARLARNAGQDQKLSPTPFLVKAVAATLQRLPRFNAAFDAAGSQLVLRDYVNVGLAIDTPGGLVIGVIRACDVKSVDEIGAEAVALAHKARTKGLSLSDMSGGGFTVSALGPLGGTGFTPIINGPEIAILGVSRIFPAPTRGPDGDLAWRSAAPVALSYDHRAINGADAGRFMGTMQVEIAALAETFAAPAPAA
jgi:pyruvate dehydrogenase E2 component (dihydrolipoamide acetyltransferase)